MKIYVNRVCKRSKNLLLFLEIKFKDYILIVSKYINVYVNIYIYIYMYKIKYNSFDMCVYIIYILGW